MWTYPSRSDIAAVKPQRTTIMGPKLMLLETLAEFPGEIPVRGAARALRGMLCVGGLSGRGILGRLCGGVVFGKGERRGVELDPCFQHVFS